MRLIWHLFWSLSQSPIHKQYFHEFLSIYHILIQVVNHGEVIMSSQQFPNIILNFGSLCQAHSSVEKAGLIGLVKIRYIETDDNLTLRGDKLKEAIEKDRENGYVPFFVSIF